jgi:hypothetical protein
VTRTTSSYYHQGADKNLAEAWTKVAATLRELRRTIRRVCRQLNQFDWTTVRSVTDDFVVFPADGSHTFYDDYGDLVASVPPERIELLRQRGYLGRADRLAQLSFRRGCYRPAGRGKHVT